jgi:hypothetical protein
MTNQLTSRFITHPSLVEKSNNQTILLIDADDNQIEDIGFFCKVSNKDYDIYLYHTGLNDPIWFDQISALADCVLIADSSAILVTDAIRFGKQSIAHSPLEYFQDREDKLVNNTFKETE